jgi:hypothetical protein
MKLIIKCKVCREIIENHDLDANFDFNEKSPITFKKANFHSYCYELEVEEAKQIQSKKAGYKNRYDEYLSNL